MLTLLCLRLGVAFGRIVRLNYTEPSWCPNVWVSSCCVSLMCLKYDLILLSAMRSAGCMMWLKPSQRLNILYKCITSYIRCSFFCQSGPVPNCAARRSTDLRPSGHRPGHSSSSPGRPWCPFLPWVYCSRRYLECGKEYFVCPLFHVVKFVVSRVCFVEKWTCICFFVGWYLMQWVDVISF